MWIEKEGWRKKKREEARSARVGRRERQGRWLLAVGHQVFYLKMGEESERLTERGEGANGYRLLVFEICYWLVTIGC